MCRIPIVTFKTRVMQYENAGMSFVSFLEFCVAKGNRQSNLLWARQAFSNILIRIATGQIFEIN